MPAAYLGAEVEQPIPRIDLSSPEGEPVGMRPVSSRLTGDRNAVARADDKSPLSLSEETCRVGEGYDGTIEPSLELLS